MYEKNDKRRLYWLIDEYLAERIDAATFCDEFYYSFSLEVERRNLTELELSAFSELDLIASRFSEFIEDHQLDSHAFSSQQELRQQILETRNKLVKAS